MTPKEKSEELVDRFLLLPIDFPYNDTQDGQCIGNGYMLYNSAKQCALIAVDAIIKAMRKGVPEVGFGTGYWSEVKQEIEKL